MTEPERGANEYVLSARAQWKQLLDVAKGTSPKGIEKTAKAIASAAGVGWQNVKEKLEAIQSALRAGRDEEWILNRGQKQTIADHRKARMEKRLDPYVMMGWKVTEDTRYAVKCEVLRICKVLGIKDSETFFTWLHAEMSSWTDPQLRHSAGMPRLKKSERNPPALAVGSSK